MFEKILLAVDGSEHSKKATAAAADIGKKSGGEVHVLFIHEIGSFAPVESTTEAKAMADGVVEELRAGGVEATGMRSVRGPDRRRPPSWRPPGRSVPT